jgi:hypothetical protein
MSTSKQQTFSMVTGNCKSGRAEKNGFTKSRVEERSNTSTLRVIKGDEIEPSAWGYNWATLFLVDINTGIWPSWWGESRI